MGSYLLRRVLVMFPTLIGVSFFVFILINLPPGSYLDAYVAQLQADGMDVTRDQMAAIERRYGFDQPLFVQYWRWISGFPRGDFGVSFLYHGRRTGAIIGPYMANTAILAFMTQAFILGVGIPIGIYSARHQYTLGDNLFTFIGFVGLSIPNFLLALILMFLAYALFNVPSVGGLFSDEYLGQPWSFGKGIDMLKHLWVPVIVLGTAGTAGTIRKMRANLLDVLKIQYVMTARSKGLPERRVVYKHAVRNALSPIIMSVGMWFPQLIAGATIVSIVLSLPTLGPILFQALRMQDMYLAGSILFLQCCLLLLGNLLADIALALNDPRIEYS